MALSGLILLCCASWAECADWVYVGISPGGNEKIYFDKESLEAADRKILIARVRMEYLTPEFTMDSLRNVRERREVREIDCSDYKYQGIEFTEYYDDGDSEYRELAQWHVNHKRWIFVEPDSVDGMVNKAACLLAEEKLKSAPIGRSPVTSMPPGAGIRPPRGR